MNKPSVIALEEMQKTVPPEDCSGRIYPEWEREDIARYMQQAAEMQRDRDIDYYIHLVTPPEWVLLPIQKEFKNTIGD